MESKNSDKTDLTGVTVTTSNGTETPNIVTDNAVRSSGYLQLDNSNSNWNWYDSYRQYSPPISTKTISSEEIYEMQKSVFDSNMSDEMKIKLISYLGKNLY